MSKMSAMWAKNAYEADISTVPTAAGDEVIQLIKCDSRQFLDPANIGGSALNRNCNRERFRSGHGGIELSAARAGRPARPDLG